MKSAKKVNAKNLMMMGLCLSTASNSFAAENGHGFFGLFKRKKREPEVRRAQPVYPEYPSYQPVKEWASEVATPDVSQVDKEWRPMVLGTIDGINSSIFSFNNALASTGIGDMYGPISEYGKLLTPEERTAWIEKNKKFGTLPKEPARTSCVDFVLARLEKGYRNAGKSARFAELKRKVVSHAGQGVVLLEELEKDGWTMVYWNPDEKNPSTAIRTEADKQGNHKPSHHTWTNSTVKHQGKYLPGVQLMDDVEQAKLQARFPDIEVRKNFPGLQVSPQNRVVDYRPTLPTTPTNYNDLAKLESAPLFVGVANGGYHVYLGSQGNIIESHSARNPNDPTNIEVRNFQNWGIGAGEGFGSGVIAVPPGAWQK